MNHQDFTQVILRKPKESGEIVLKYNAGKNRKSNDESMKKIENEEIKLATSTDEIKPEQKKN